VQQNEIEMETIAVTQNNTYAHNQERVSLLNRFLNWSNNQQGNRLLWLGVILAFHGCILTPLTVMAVLLGGNSLTLFMIAIVAMGMSLVTNLAAMPTKITIPVFGLSLLMDLVIVGIAVAHGFDIASTYI
jgi:hypothetical protein